MDGEVSLNERIEVVAAFGVGLYPCRPVKFRRASGREVVISEIGLVHPIARGRRLIHAFDVTDGQADYRLEFDAERLTWHLVLEADRI